MHIEKEFKVDDLPAGYKERFDNATERVMDAAEKLLLVSEEFERDQIELWRDGFKVTIERMTPEERNKNEHE